MNTHPQRIGRYRIDGVLAESERAMVYKATDETTQRQVAIKLLAGEFAERAERLQRFYNEARLMQTLQHRNIVTVYEFGVHEGNPYLVMEYLEGEPLDKIIAGRPNMSMVEKLGWIILCCFALEHAHQRGVVHRDFQPANVMVLKDGDFKLIGFDIARIADISDGSKTSAGQVGGTISYMSPEQISGQKVDNRTDIFSAGTVLYQLLTGIRPFDGKDAMSTLMKIIGEDPPSLKSHIRGYPPALDEVLRKALAKNREDRYASVEDFGRDLCRVQDQLPRGGCGGEITEEADEYSGGYGSPREWPEPAIPSPSPKHEDADLAPREIYTEAPRRTYARPPAEEREGEQDQTGIYRSEATAAASPARPKSDQPEPGYSIVSVFYATDRKPTKSKDVGGFYGRERSDEPIQLGTCDVSIPKTHRLGKLETAGPMEAVLKGASPEKHIMLLAIQPCEEGDYFTLLKHRIGSSTSKDAFVFIHGYRVSFANAARRTAQLAHDLQFEGAPIFFSWPSRARLLGYFADEATAEWSARHLKDFLQRLVKQTRPSTVHLIAHSMGNRCLAAALQAIAQEQGNALPPIFQHVILAAPDIDVGVFQQLADVIRQPAHKVTLYASSKDNALRISRWFHRYPRAGYSGKDIRVWPGIDTVDISALDCDVLGHSYFADNRIAVSDLHYLLLENLDPPQRSGLKKVEFQDSCYWSFVP